jgi:hypothetical protein
MQYGGTELLSAIMQYISKDSNPFLLVYSRLCSVTLSFPFTSIISINKFHHIFKF